MSTRHDSVKSYSRTYTDWTPQEEQELVRMMTQERDRKVYSSYDETCKVVARRLNRAFHDGQPVRTMPNVNTKFSRMLVKAFWESEPEV